MPAGRSSASGRRRSRRRSPRSSISSLVTTALIEIPPPKCFETVTRSGTTPSCSKAHIVPSLARPVCASSRTKSAPRALAAAATRPSQPGGGSITPPALNSGSVMTAARPGEVWASSSSRLASRQAMSHSGNVAGRAAEAVRCEHRVAAGSARRREAGAPARVGDGARRVAESPWKLTCGLATSKRPVAASSQCRCAASFESEPESAKKLFESGDGSVAASRSASAISCTL